MASRLTDQVHAGKLERLTLDMVKIRSYTGDSREVAEFYGQYLRDIGLEVEMHRDFSNSPCVVARLRGAGGGPTLTFNGHIDTVPVDHPAPYLANGNVYGRGAADMKGGLASIAEAARVIRDSGTRLKGDLLLIAHGLHENPGGHGEDLINLVQKGITGDAAVIAEVASDALPVFGLGQAMFDITVSRPGEATHELKTAGGTPHPILAAVQMVNLMQAKQAELQAKPPLPYVGHESIFFGMFHGGDFFNRWTTSCNLVGTRRYGPGSTLDDIRAELAKIAKQVEADTGAQVAPNLVPVRDGFRLEESEPLVVKVRQAYQKVTGKELPLTGIRIVGDAAIFIRKGKIPCVYHGPGGFGAHADIEGISVSELVRAAKVYVETAREFLGVEGK
jgi:acetylornithine deacetylase/succinyl-diaminopimelate desuccinylase-like protein